MAAAAPFSVGPELTIYQVAELRTAWLAAYAAGTRRFDLSSVAEIDGAGVQLLVALWRLGRRDGDAVQLVAPSPAVGDALALAGAAAIVETPTAPGSHDA